jgi:hypothetical protein
MAAVPLAQAQRRLWLAKALLFVICLLPLVRAGWLVLAGSLVNPVEFITRSTGTWALVWLWLTLAISPLKHFSGWSLPMRLRRELGLFAFFYACLHLLCYLWFDKFFDWQAIVSRSARPAVHQHRHTGVGAAAAAGDHLYRRLDSPPQAQLGAAALAGVSGGAGLVAALFSGSETRPARAAAICTGAGPVAGLARVSAWPKPVTGRLTHAQGMQWAVKHVALTV